MAKIPAHCPHCNARFETTSVIGGSGIINMVGNKITCPRCGQLADIVDGTYYLKDDVVQFIRSSQLSSDEARRLARIIEKAQKENTTAADLKAIIDREIPKASGITKFLTEGWNLPAVLGIILGVILWYYPRSAPADSNGPPARANVKTKAVHIPQTSKRSARRHRGRSKVRLLKPNKQKK